MSVGRAVTDDPLACLKPKSHQASLAGTKPGSKVLSEVLVPKSILTEICGSAKSHKLKSFLRHSTRHHFCKEVLVYLVQAQPDNKHNGASKLKMNHDYDMPMGIAWSS